MILTKQEAAERLNVKTRTLELYVQQGKLSVTYAKGKRGRVAQFDESELDALKQQMEEESVYPSRGALVANPANSHAMIANNSELLQAFAAIAAQVSPRPEVAIESKPLLKLKECAALTGLSRDFLVDAIKSKKLKAKILGRGWRIKRIDLDSYINKL